jgi:uncharacterized protein YciI
MKYFFCKLTPPRPTFLVDMTDDERQLMREHVGYWSALAAKGMAIVFGPVADPTGGYGIGIVEAADEAAMRDLSANDPVMKANAGFSYGIYAMPQAVLRERAPSH